MIKLEHVVLPSPEEMDFAIQGMRNPKNSWDRMDSYETHIEDENTLETAPFEYFVGENDHKLMKQLSDGGQPHRKYMRMMPVMVRITAPLYWWKEFDTYKVGTVANSCSTMHKIQAKEFTLSDFSCEHLDHANTCMLKDIVRVLNKNRTMFLETKEKTTWWQMIQLLPTSYNQTRNVLLNYEVLANIYKWRKAHKLDEWVNFCKWVETLPYSELITGEQ